MPDGADYRNATGKNRPRQRSSLKLHKSSSEPPPRPTIIRRTRCEDSPAQWRERFALVVIALNGSGIDYHWQRRIAAFNTCKISCSAAPVFEVITPTRVQGRGVVF